MGLAEDLDILLQKLGFRKVVDATPDMLNKDITEQCATYAGTGSCNSSISGEFVLWESRFPLQGAIGIYIDILWIADFLPREGTSTCDITIEIIGEGENYSITLFKKHFDVCPYYV